MTNVMGIRGASPDFNPDDVMSEEQLASSQFDTADDEAERHDGSGAGGGTKAPFPLVKVLLIGLAVIVLGWTAYSTLAPLFSSQAPTDGAHQGRTMADMQRSATAAMPQRMPQMPMGAPTLALQEPSNAMAASQASPGTPAPDALHPSGPVDAVNSVGGVTDTAPSVPSPDVTEAPNGSVTSKRLAVMEASITRIDAQVEALQKSVSASALIDTRGSGAAKAPHKGARIRATTNAGEKLAVRTRVEEKAASRANRVGPKLKAVLVGQAWFQTTSGITLTVSPGDVVPGYGQVQSINVDAGEVRFSDGTVVR